MSLQNKLLKILNCNFRLLPCNIFLLMYSFMRKKLTLFFLSLSVFILQYTTAFSQADPTGGGTKTPVVKTIESFGAIADDTVDDSEAFNKAVDFFNNAGSVNVDYATQYGVLKFGAGTYIIGEQRDTGSNFKLPRYYNKPFMGVDGLIIEGTTFNCSGDNILLSKIKVKDSSYYGYFDVSDPNNPVAAPYNPSNAHIKSAASIIAIYLGWSCKNVIVRNLELNGGSNTFKVGGKKDETGWQLNSIGIYCGTGQGISLSNIYIYNFGEDGLELRYADDYDGSHWNITIDSLRSYWNGRQAMSWTGGSGLKVENSEFSYTGFLVGHDGSETTITPGTTSQSPGANIDIEPFSGEVVRAGYFENCKINGQALDGSLNLTNDVDSVFFNNCYITGSLVSNPDFSIGKRSIEVNTYDSKAIQFRSCEIRGMITDENKITTSPDRLTSFTGCNLYETNTNYQNNDLGFISHQGKVLFDSCNIYQVNKRPYIYGKNPAGATAHDIVSPDYYTTFNNCNFISTYDRVLNYWTWDAANRLYFTRFTGNNTFTHTAVNATGDSRNYLSQNFTINGGPDASQPSSFTFPDMDYFTGYVSPSISFYMSLATDSNANIRPIIMGETPCEYLNVVIGSGNTGRAAFFPNTHPLYIGENTTLRVKKGNALILYGPVYLGGKIIVDSGAYVNFRYASDTGQHTTFYYLNNTTLNQHLIIKPGAKVNVTNGFVYVGGPYGYDTVHVAHHSDLMAPDVFLRSTIDRTIYDNPNFSGCTLFQPGSISSKPAGSPTRETISSNFIVKLVPSPTHDDFKVLLDKPATRLTIRMTSTDGKIVLTQNSSGTNATVHIAKLAAGVYFVEVTDGIHKSVQRLIKK